MKTGIFQYLMFIFGFPLAVLQSQGEPFINKKNYFELHTEISASELIKCQTTNFVVSVCNQGDITANECILDIELVKQFEQLSDASLPFVIVKSGMYRFRLGDLKKDQCFTLRFNAKVLCHAVISGQTLCYNAHAYLDKLNNESNWNWSGANIQVEGECLSGTVEFKINNTGKGDMKNAGNYSIIKNDKFYLNSTYKLSAGESKVINVPSDGATWILEATQEINHPDQSILSKTIEACSTNSGFDIGYVMMYPLPEQGLDHDEECQEVKEMSDSNSVAGFPYGYGPANLVSSNTDLEYNIRFQNTTKADVSELKIIDVLSPALDPHSIYGIVSSHNFEMQLDSNQHLNFVFKNIKLSSSSIDPSNSRGFISFKIKQKPGNFTRTLIKNEANIFLGGNTVVTARPIYHEVGRVIGVVAASDTDKPEKVLYDPEQDKFSTIFQIETKAYDQLIWTITDVLGQKICSGQVYGKTIKLPSSYNFRGMYYMEIPTEKKGKVYRKLFLN
jgi:hypothetical protein